MARRRTGPCANSGVAPTSVNKAATASAFTERAGERITSNLHFLPGCLVGSAARLARETPETASALSRIPAAGVMRRRSKHPFWLRADCCMLVLVPRAGGEQTSMRRLP
jgi:hypothetical protein